MLYLLPIKIVAQDCTGLRLYGLQHALNYDAAATILMMVHVLYAAAGCIDSVSI